MLANFCTTKYFYTTAIIMDGNGRWALGRDLPRAGRPTARA